MFCRLSSTIAIAFFAVTTAGHTTLGWAQSVRSKQDRECWDRHKGYVAYVKCLASVMEPLNLKRREEFGEVYGAKEYLQCALTRPPGDTYCERHRLKRRLEPEYWPYAGKVASVKWPEAPKQSVYRKGMTPKEYFNALCKAEAGEFIYRTAENVEGVYQIRPRLKASTYELRDRYVMEDPYGYTDQEATDPELIFVGRGVYGYFETPQVKHSRFGSHSSNRQRELRHESYFIDPPSGAIVARFSGFDQNNFKSMMREFDTKPKSRYGYTWRGISRPHDRDYGIAGGEVIIVDLESKDILATWRGFAQNRAIKTPGPAISWETAPACPLLSSGKFPKDFIAYFITRVLHPAAR